MRRLAIGLVIVCSGCQNLSPLSPTRSLTVQTPLVTSPLPRVCPDGLFFDGLTCVALLPNLRTPLSCQGREPIGRVCAY